MATQGLIRIGMILACVSPSIDLLQLSRAT